MEATRFIEQLERMGRDDLLAVAATVRAGLDSADGEISWWRATTSAAASLRAARRTRQAAMLAHAAVCAVQTAGIRCGLDVEAHDDVTVVARAAADAARAMVADATGPCERASAPALLSPFSLLLTAA